MTSCSQQTSKSKDVPEREAEAAKYSGQIVGEYDVYIGWLK